MIFDDNEVEDNMDFHSLQYTISNSFWLNENLKKGNNNS
jgi:hypothetical protein